MLKKPLVSIVLPAFNEEAILVPNLKLVLEYTETLKEQYDWEILIINDGSSDQTGRLAQEMAAEHDQVHVFHHPRNFGLGQALAFGFLNTRGDYVVTMDIDLSYSPQHIGALLERIQESHAKLVLASPYMEGGSISNVPGLRKTMSIWANRFLSKVSHGRLSTLTCMVRAYDGPFIRALNHRAVGMDVMPETIYKTMILRGAIEQIPADLDWGPQLKAGSGRTSSMKILRHIFGTLFSGFLLRPFAFLIVPGLVLLAFAAYVNFWMVVHFIDAWSAIPATHEGLKFGKAVQMAYQEYPHTFVVGLLSLMLSIQLVGLGAIALQAKVYFEELFHLGSAGLSHLRKPRERDS